MIHNWCTVYPRGLKEYTLVEIVHLLETRTVHNEYTVHLGVAKDCNFCKTVYTLKTQMVQNQYTVLLGVAKDYNLCETVYTLKTRMANNQYAGYPWWPKKNTLLKPCYMVLVIITRFLDTNRFREINTQLGTRYFLV